MAEFEKKGREERLEVFKQIKIDDCDAASSPTYLPLYKIRARYWRSAAVGNFIESRGPVSCQSKR